MEKREEEESNSHQKWAKVLQFNLEAPTTQSKLVKSKMTNGKQRRKKILLTIKLRELKKLMTMTNGRMLMMMIKRQKSRKTRLMIQMMMMMTLIWNLPSWCLSFWNLIQHRPVVVYLTRFIAKKFKCKFDNEVFKSEVHLLDHFTEKHDKDFKAWLNKTNKKTKWSQIKIFVNSTYKNTFTLSNTFKKLWIAHNINKHSFSELTLGKRNIEFSSIYFLTMEQSCTINGLLQCT